MGRVNELNGYDESKAKRAGKFKIQKFDQKATVASDINFISQCYFVSICGI